MATQNSQYRLFFAGHDLGHVHKDSRFFLSFKIPDSETVSHEVPVLRLLIGDDSEMKSQMLSPDIFNHSAQSGDFIIFEVIFGSMNFLLSKPLFLEDSIVSDLLSDGHVFESSGIEK